MRGIFDATNINKFNVKSFLQKNIKPSEDFFYGTHYRTSAYLLDGTYLPCVNFCNKTDYIEQAKQTIYEDQGKAHYTTLLEAYLTGNTISFNTIEKVDLSPFAWSDELINKINQGKQEYTLDFKIFTAKMKDNKQFNFAVKNPGFIDLPVGYSFQDITEIHNDKIIDDNGNEVDYHYSHSPLFYRDKNYFTCYYE